MTQEHYNFEYPPMHLAFDLGDDALVYNVSKYLVRDKGTPVKDARKALELIQARMQWEVTGLKMKRLYGRPVEPKVHNDIKRFCLQFGNPQLYFILMNTYTRNLQDAENALKEHLSFMEIMHAEA